MNPPPGLKLWIVTPKRSGVVTEALALVLLFLRAPFSWPGFFAFFSCAMRLIPPFRSANRGGFVKSLVNFTTRVSNHHDFFVKHFSRMFEIIFTSSRAIFFFEARGIFFDSPFRKKIVDLIFITFHSEFRAAHIVRDDHVAIFLAQFFLRVFFEHRLFPRRSRPRGMNARFAR